MPGLPLQAGADDLLGKPFDPLELHARIQSLVRLKRYIDELESAESVIPRHGRDHRSTLKSGRSGKSHEP